MKQLLLLSALLLFSALGAQRSGNFGAAKFSPPDGKKLLIIGQDVGSVGGVNNFMDGYVDSFTDFPPAGVTTYTSIPSLGGLIVPANWGAGTIWAQGYLNTSRFDGATIAIGLYLVNELENINNGQHDGAIRQLAAWVKGARRPVFLRIGYEFDGPWNSYAPSSFVAAWKKIVHIFDEADVRNVAYVWQSAGVNTPNIDSWYPGDEYVNWLGYSHFDGPNPGQRMRSFAQAHPKPIMIAEATPRIDINAGNAQSNWARWFQPLFSTVYANDGIKALAYINADWGSQPMWQGQGWGDSRVQVSPFIRDAWSAEMSKDVWYAGGPELFEQLGYTQWITTSTADNQFQDAELLITRRGNSQELSITDGKKNNGLMIYDISGRLLHQDDSQRTHYTFETHNWPDSAILVTVLRGHYKISKTLMLIN